ncbi:hypothetical protein LEP1GSC151_0428 [Leptospira interrogans serovar Grippotyphosa str. LT2186]|uniref:Uncharacterized protein n=1 Tax=Leptospira interrogans serovar Grippotyphosa str. LT2186 TaxID=1001599 RepID=M3FMI7_LEPIR|nr:hypothetical protein LEP1GSC151_0428 [Leptospira interrogans serovar Grippotyphosa str. LT2186]
MLLVFERFLADPKQLIKNPYLVFKKFFGKFKIIRRVFSKFELSV